MGEEGKGDEKGKGQQRRGWGGGEGMPDLP